MHFCYLSLDLALDAAWFCNVIRRRKSTVNRLVVCLVAVERLRIFAEQVPKFTDAFAFPSFVASSPDTAIARLDSFALRRRLVVFSWNSPLLFRWRRL